MKQASGRRSPKAKRAVASTSSVIPPSSRRHVWLAVLVLTILAAVSFGPAIIAPFDFDDYPGIVDNASIRRLWPADYLRPSAERATPVGGRPIVGLSLAFNYRINALLGVAQAPLTTSAAQTTGYHLINIALHVVIALLLTLILQEVMRRERIVEENYASLIAIAVAGLWLIHPIQTEAVDYVIQRTELLGAFFIVLGFYCVVRGAGSAGRSPSLTEPEKPLWWNVGAVLCAVLGVASKETVVVLPAVVVAYDVAFAPVGTRVRAVWASRWRFYVALICACGLTALAMSGGRGHSAGFGGPVTAGAYLYSQGWAIANYLRLLLWPDRLAFDYGLRPIGGAAPLVGWLVVGALAFGTAVAWLRPATRKLAFLGTWFFALLAPSSSFIPIHTEIAAERRVYLASVSVIVCAALGLRWVRSIEDRASRRMVRRWVVFASAIAIALLSSSGALEIATHVSLPAGVIRVALGIIAGILVALLTDYRPGGVWAGVLSLAVAYCVGSAVRSETYDDLVRRWSNGVMRTPENARAYDNLASAILRADTPHVAAADSVLQVAMKIDPAFGPAWYRAGTIALARGQYERAESLLRRALELQPEDAATTGKLADVYLARREPAKAIPLLRAYAHYRANAETSTELGVAYLMARQLDSAIAPLMDAARADPTRPDAPRYLGATLVELGRGAEAVPFLTSAARLEPSAAVTRATLALAYAQSGADSAARANAAEVASATDAPVVALVLAGRAMTLVHHDTTAVVYLRRAVALKPDDAEALSRLAIALHGAGNDAEAQRLLERVLQAVPGYRTAVDGMRELRAR